MLCTCIHCGWVHFAVTDSYAKIESRKFMNYYKKQPKETQEMFGLGQTYKKVYSGYVGCDVCGRNQFRPAKDEDCPAGCTIGPVIWGQYNSGESMFEEPPLSKSQLRRIKIQNEAKAETKDRSRQRIGKKAKKEVT